MLLSTDEKPRARLTPQRPSGSTRGGLWRKPLERGDTIGEAVGGVAASRLLDDARRNIATKFPSRCVIGVATLGGEDAVSLAFFGVTRVVLGAAGIWLAARNPAHFESSDSESLSLAILPGPKHYNPVCLVPGITKRGEG